MKKLCVLVVLVIGGLAVVPRDTADAAGNACAPSGRICVVTDWCRTVCDGFAKCDHHCQCVCL